MAWGKNGTPETLGSADADLTISDLNGVKFNQFMCHAIGASGGNHNNKWNFNNDSGSNYAIRKSISGGTDSTSTSQTNMYWHDDNASTEQFSIVYAIGISSEEKLVIHFDIDNSAGTGAGTAPRRTEGVGKWVDTTNTIDRVDKFTTTGNEDTNSNLSALGSDITPAAAAVTKIQDGAVFYETDTNKSYILNNSTWSEEGE